jgi:hypothetical protein
MHTAKDHLVTLPFAYTRQSLHVAHTCALGWRAGVPARAFAVRAVARRTAKRHRGARQRSMARQSKTHGNDAGHGKGPVTHGKDMWHGNANDARQRTHARQQRRTHGNVWRARQRGVLGETHGKVCVAGHDFAVSPLPCVDARQGLCRVFCGLCRATCPHGKVLLSGSTGPNSILMG